LLISTVATVATISTVASIGATVGRLSVRLSSVTMATVSAMATIRAETSVGSVALGSDGSMTDRCSSGVRSSFLSFRDNNGGGSDTSEGTGVGTNDTGCTTSSCGTKSSGESSKVGETSEVTESSGGGGSGRSSVSIGEGSIPLERLSRKINSRGCELASKAASSGNVIDSSRSRRGLVGSGEGGVSCSSIDT